MRVFDVAIFGITKYNQSVRKFARPVLPQINRGLMECDIPYHRAYNKGELDTDWPMSGIEKAYGMCLREYCDHAPEQFMIETQALGYLNLPAARERISEIQNYSEGCRIGYSCDIKPTLHKPWKSVAAVDPAGFDAAMKAPEFYGILN